MRLFNHGDGDESQKQQVEHFFEEQDDQDRYIEMIQANMVSKDMEQRTLEISLAIVEKSFFWKFRSTKSKLKKVFEVYYTLQQILNQEEQDEQ
jgi:hypothetical protein